MKTDMIDHVDRVIYRYRLITHEAKPHYYNIKGIVYVIPFQSDSQWDPLEFRKADIMKIFLFFNMNMDNFELRWAKK